MGVEHHGDPVFFDRDNSIPRLHLARGGIVCQIECDTGKQKFLKPSGVRKIDPRLLTFDQAFDNETVRPPEEQGLAEIFEEPQPGSHF
jgi:hypothetical protein